MPNGEIVFDMEQCKHELEQIEVSKADKTKPQRILNSKEHAQFRGAVGGLGWFVDHCCPQLSFQLAELRREQSSEGTWERRWRWRWWCVCGWVVCACVRVGRRRIG